MISECDSCISPYNIRSYLDTVISECGSCISQSNLDMFQLQLPASFFAYRKQQHRWTCGPVQLWRKAAVDIWGSSLPLFSKLDLIFCYFGIRKFATHWVSLGFFCTIVPLSVFTPEVGMLATCHCLPIVFLSLPIGSHAGNRWFPLFAPSALQMLFLVSG